MEISKGLQEEILAVQNKLKNAIRDHQICVGKLKDDPNNTDILGQIQEIHLHIVSLGRCQKQVVQRLRKEVEAFKAQNVNGAKVSIASLLGLNNNNHITNNNEEKHERKTAPVVVSAKPSKEDYEEIVRNGDVPSPPQDVRRPKHRSVSVETISGEDDVIEVSMDENSNEKQEDLERQRKTEDDEKVNFLSGLGLITTVRYAELQNKRAERKRRSTANPQFVYSSLEMPTKRKRHSYLQSTGCAPQTRQTTARLNGPSPPPGKVSPPKAVSPPTRTVTKSLIPVQKSTTRPNILRNVTDSKVYVSKAKTESEACQVQLPTPSVKPIVTQSANSKTVHIPGLPSSLTIERIESDSVVCINCRNPGTLTVCENCSASYHVSCHSISPPPPRTCPKCALVNEEEEGRLRFRKDEELATATHATGIIRKTGEDAEIHKATRGLYKADATQKRHSISSALGISQLPSSTFLIPISPNGIPTTSVGQTDTVASCTIDREQSENSVPYSSIVFNQLPRSSITYVNSEPSQVSYAYQLPANNTQPEKHQSYLIVQKITEPVGRSGSQHSGNQTERSILPAVLNYQLPTTSGNNARVQSEVSVSHSTLLFDKHVPSRNRKKPKRAVPPLNRIVNPEKLCIPAECKLEQSTVNGRKPGRIKQSRAKLGVNQLRTARATEILLPAYDITESDEQLQITKSAAGAEEATILGNRSKYRSRTGGILHSLFTGHNKSYIITDHSGESRGTNASAVDNDSDPYQQLHHQEQQLESAGAQSSDPAGQIQRGALTKFFGHVKLEEAHLSAPPRAKLVRKSVTASEDNENCTNENSRGSGRSGTPGAGELGPSDDTDDELPEHDSRQRSWLAGLLTTKDDAKGASKKTLENRYERILGSHQKPDIMTYERKRSGANSINATSAQRRSKEHGGMETTGGRKQSTRVALLRRSGCREIAPKPTEVLERAQLSAQSNSLQLRNEVSVPDDKADTERQDLSSGRRSAGSGSSSRGSNRSSRSSIDSVTPEQATDETGEHSRRGRAATDFEEHLGINSVSPENMQVLEQFESAMLEADRGNAATC